MITNWLRGEGQILPLKFSINILDSFASPQLPVTPAIDQDTTHLLFSGTIFQRSSANVEGGVCLAQVRSLPLLYRKLELSVGATAEGRSIENESEIPKLVKRQLISLHKSLPRDLYSFWDLFPNYMSSLSDGRAGKSGFA